MPFILIEIMSDPFAAQLSAFKKSLKSTNDLPQQRRVVQNTKRPLDIVQKQRTSSFSSSETTESIESKSKHQKLNDSKELESKTKINSNTINETVTTVAEATAITVAAQAAAASGSGNLTMKLMSSSDYIKSKDRDVPVFELETSLGFKVDAQLLKCLSNVDRIQYNPETSSFQYLSLHNIKTGDDLLRVLKNQPAYAGLSVKQLKDGWNNCLSTISKLEKDNEIIVHKTKKDNSPRHIWLNFDKLPIKVYNGVQSIQNWEILTGQQSSQQQNSANQSKPKVKSLDMIFYEMWNNVHIPHHDDLVKLLLDNGLKPTNVEHESLKNKKIASVQERKQKKARRGKITNVHMRGILKDYSGKLK